ncbi:MFS transporter [Alkanindiges hydrocarboniclasticus]|nr:MFS transporter [Alkanindiges hydrocarboniclasticus]
MSTPAVPTAQPISNPAPQIFLMILALMCIALNLRPIMAAVSPILHLIQATTGLSDANVSLLTTFPVFVMGLFALLGAYIQRIISEKNGILLSVGLVMLACLSRYWFHSGVALLLTAVVGGMGIALAQVLIPAFIKTHAPERAGTLMGFYTTAIMAGAAMTAAVSSPLSHLWGWHNFLAMLAIPAFLAALLWFMATRKLSGIKPQQTIRLPLKSPRAWLLMLFFGIGTAAYTLVLAWLPPYFNQLGWNTTQSGLLLSAVTVCEVLTGLTLSSIIHRFPDRRPLLWFVLTILLIGLFLLIYIPNQFIILTIMMLGIGIGALFPLTLIVAMDHVRNAAQAGSLLGFVQGGGYMLASFMPLLAGLVRQHSSQLTQAWQIMLVGVVVLWLMTFRLKPNSPL